METCIFDTIVIGAGVEGSATAFQLSQRGVKTLLLEQFPLPHSRGSSHGQTRITRKSYEEEFYCQMMHYCTEAWSDIQKRSGMTLYQQIGYLALGPDGSSFQRDTINAMSRQGAEYTVISPSQLARRYPMLRYPSNMAGVYDPNGGILMAEKALQALQSLYRQQGGVLKDSEKVTKVIPGQRVKVITSKGEYSCRSVVLCCGPWTNALVRDLNLNLPLQPVRISVCYWPEKEPGSHSKDKLPTFFQDKCCDGYSIYGLPSEEYPGHVKICLHGGPEIDPDHRDSVSNDWVSRLVSSYVNSHFPGLDDTPSVVESCIYTLTPDRHCILDQHPQWPNVVIGAGFSGHGFKLAPAVGLILSDLSMGTTPSYDMSPFRISRFDGVTKKRSSL